MDDLPQDFLIVNSSVNVEFLENKTGEIAARAIYCRNGKECSANWE